MFRYTAPMSGRRSSSAAVLLLSWWSMAGVIACSEIDYDLFRPLPFQGDTGGSGSGGTGTATGAAGPVEGSGGEDVVCVEVGCGAPNGSGGSMGMGGAVPLPVPPPPKECISKRRPGFGLVHLMFDGSGKCVAPGDATTILEIPAYEVAMVDCEDEPGQDWTIYVDSLLSWEFRSELLGMNLDMQLAGVVDGTPAVLFDPHQGYNQRFVAALAGDAVRLSPRNAPAMCLTQVSDGIVLKPCSPDNPDQLIRVIACAQ